MFPSLVTTHIIIMSVQSCSNACKCSSLIMTHFPKTLININVYNICSPGCILPYAVFRSKISSILIVKSQFKYDHILVMVFQSLQMPAHSIAGTCKHISCLEISHLGCQICVASQSVCIIKCLLRCPAAANLFSHVTIMCVVSHLCVLTCVIGVAQPM